ncbi:General secretion pathway protein K [compost metagenome]
MRIKAVKMLGRNLAAPLNNRRGIALLMATASIMLISYFAMELSYDTNIEYEVNAKSLNRLKAYYAAKSGMQLSLLRIKVYQQAQSKFGQQLGNNSAMLDQIWKFPFAWPLPIPDDLNAVDKDTFNKMTKESIMDAAYMVTIEDEGSKIDINDLNSPSKTLRENTAKQLLAVFQQKLKEDEKFAREYSNFRFDELINKIADWMSAKSQSANGGDKAAAYNQMNADSQSTYYPPNRSFRTLSEMHMVPGMDDELYNILEPRITIYGMKGINPNIATRDVLKTLDAGMTDEAVAEIVKRRDSQDEGGPFKDEEEFWQFVQSKGVRLEANPPPPLIFDSVMNFKIRSTGEFAGTAREIIAIVMDFDKTAAKVKTLVDKEKADESGEEQPDSDGSKQKSSTPTTKKSKVSKGPPRIVYWNER